ncbi:MAG: response regulator [Ardenticatenaceae bacterium]
MNSLRILIVDDHDVVRLGLATLLSRYRRFQVVAQASHAKQAERYAQHYKPDVIIMDVRLPGKSGIEATREIMGKMPDTKVIILTSYTQEQQLFEAISAGAYAYLLKEVGSNDLIRALESVARGEAWIDPKLTRSVLMRVRDAERELEAKVFAILSKQELRILALISTGKSNKKIAEVLQISDGTVRNYVTNLMRKLNVGSRVEAAVFALKHHIHDHVPLPDVSP